MLTSSMIDSALIASMTFAFASVLLVIVAWYQQTPAIQRLVDFIKSDREYCVGHEVEAKAERLRLESKVEYWENTAIAGIFLAVGFATVFRIFMFAKLYFV